MAYPIYCDWEGCELHADMLVSQTANGDTLAWCAEHWVLFAATVAQSAGVDTGLPPAPEVAPEPEADTEPNQQTATATLQAVAALEALAAPQRPLEGEVVSSDGSEASQAAAAALVDAGATVVVRRGQSASRRKHQAKVKARKERDTTGEPSE